MLQPTGTCLHRNPSPVSLTRREQQIVGLVVQGCSNAEISQRLGTSEQTVKNQLSMLYEKLQVRNRVHLAAMYLLNRAVIDPDHRCISDATIRLSPQQRTGTIG